MTTATENEIAALLCCIDPTCTVEDMVNDPGRVMAGFPEFQDELGWNKKQVAALIGSMVEKGYGTSDDNQDNGHIFWPSRLGYEIAYANL